MDGDGNALVAGYTLSSDFAGANNSNHGTQDAFVAKVSSGGLLAWATYLGGSDYEFSSFLGGGIAVDGDGNALASGYTSSSNFAGANNSNHGAIDTFVAKSATAARWSGRLTWAEATPITPTTSQWTAPETPS